MFDEAFTEGQEQKKEPENPQKTQPNNLFQPAIEPAGQKNAQHTNGLAQQDKDQRAGRRFNHAGEAAQTSVSAKNPAQDRSVIAPNRQENTGRANAPALPDQNRTAAGGFNHSETTQASAWVDTIGNPADAAQIRQTIDVYLAYDGAADALTPPQRRLLYAQLCDNPQDPDGKRYLAQLLQTIGLSASTKDDPGLFMPPSGSEAFGKGSGKQRIDGI
jgi:hypothetical protein